MKEQSYNKLYIKPLEELHDSGYKYLEVGYLTDGEYNRVASVSDVVNFGFAGMDEMPKDLGIDVSPSGEINFWSINDVLEWKKPIMSSAHVVVKSKDK